MSVAFLAVKKAPLTTHVCVSKNNQVEDECGM